MKVYELDPQPSHKEIFRRDRQNHVPDRRGCYALTTFHGDVLYVGLTNNIRRRLGEHLDDPKKTSVTSEGRALFYYWIECENLEKIERTWLNQCENTDGRMPVLNVVSSPVSV